MGVLDWTPLDGLRHSINKKAPEYGAFKTFLDVAGWVYGRCERIRTSDPFLPKEVRYQAALHTEKFEGRTIPEHRTESIYARPVGQEQAEYAQGGHYHHQHTQ